ncbi:hypothetical protein JTB14_000059 [Gonioctena quinquepunctata]|nr:hypothetical protein JTB14_000059 [Gonioctena quinquepunctata]
MGKISKNIRAKWSEGQLQAALTAIRNNESQQSVAQRFGIPRRTLRNHLRSGKITKCLGRTRVLPRDQETEFASRIIRYCNVGMPLTPSKVRHQVFRFCELNNIKHKFNMPERLVLPIP